MNHAETGKSLMIFRWMLTTSFLVIGFARGNAGVTIQLMMDEDSPPVFSMRLARVKHTELGMSFTYLPPF